MPGRPLPLPLCKATRHAIAEEKLTRTDYQMVGSNQALATRDQLAQRHYRAAEKTIVIYETCKRTGLAGIIRLKEACFIITGLHTWR